MSDVWSDLLECLDLTARPSEASGDRLSATGRNLDLGHYRVFGGQLLGQFVRAASLACPEKAVKSVHVLFARPGREDEEVGFEVERHHQGRTFTMVSVVARQAHGVLATASVSLHADEEGREIQAEFPMPPRPGAEHTVEFGLMPWETRSTTDLDSPESRPAQYDLWMRTPVVAPELAPALAVYATDLNLIGTALLPVDGVSQRDSRTGFVSAVTAHTFWFHRPFRTDDWLLLHQHSPILARGRCFGRGDMLAEDGTLLASYAQEALVRFSA